MMFSYFSEHAELPGWLPPHARSINPKYPAACDISCPITLAPVNMNRFSALGDRQLFWGQRRSQLDWSMLRGLKTMVLESESKWFWVPTAISPDVASLIVSVTL
jgi:hypothetical protein